MIVLGNITDPKLLERNLTENAIPLSVKDMDATHYDAFLLERRERMAAMIKQYYMSL